ncbi:MAG TPA: transglutaminase-like domain-containing protein [Gemmatimonadales bacterium]|nr:transglutaminase-like domain-containing protein [Gemmatimonadales bacterium]
MRQLIPLLVLAVLPSLASAQQSSAARTTVPDIRALGDSVAGSGSALVRTRRLVYWINDHFDWSATDYQRRTPAEVIARRGGNCAELASVLHLFLDSLGVRTRWVREINVQPGPTPRRQQTAANMVAQRGNSFSVFGLQHNDHVWLEVWDDSSQAWFPADPAYGVAGLVEWSAARLAMADRPAPRVKAVEPIAADMLVPFVVLAGARRGGPYDDDRTSFYLVDGFRRLYGDAIRSLPSWPVWVAAVQALAPHGRAAFAGEENLHAYTDDIAKLKDVYDSLTREAAERQLVWR